MLATFTFDASFVHNCFNSGRFPSRSLELHVIPTKRYVIPDCVFTLHSRSLIIEQLLNAATLKRYRWSARGTDFEIGEHMPSVVNEVESKSLGIRRSKYIEGTIKVRAWI